MKNLSPDSPLEMCVIPPTYDLGDNFKVRRALPSQQKRRVGPFVFLDQMGPHTFKAGQGLDVRPHPHIGLATLTYLFSGEIMHRDSLGSVQIIRPGDVNWMTAGRGIVHSERTPAELRRHDSTLSGLQCWIGLPVADEECDPAFQHIGVAQLPFVTTGGVSARIIAGNFLGQRSPLRTLSELFFVDVNLQPDAQLEVPADYAERAIYVVEGQLDLGHGETFAASQLLVLTPGRRVVLSAKAATRLVLLGGEPLDGARHLAWNFVSSSLERIEQAKEDWRAQRFPNIPNEIQEPGFMGCLKG